MSKESKGIGAFTKLIKKKITREMFLYLVFGVLTTLINFVAHKVFYDVIKMPIAVSTAIAWLISVVFAFFTNKIWVFEDKGKSAIKEAFEFFMCRVGTGILDVLIMYTTVDILSLNGDLMKILSNAVIIVLNYLASKLYIFKKD